VQEPDKIIRNFSDTDGVDDSRIRKREPKSRMDAFSEGPQNLFSGHGVAHTDIVLRMRRTCVRMKLLTSSSWAL
jgi:hypothetical protein